METQKTNAPKTEIGRDMLPVPGFCRRVAGAVACRAGGYLSSLAPQTHWHDITLKVPEPRGKHRGRADSD